MRGLIIAAGRGSRMGHLTDERPKCLLPIAGRPLLERTVENLEAAGCTDIVVIVGYKAEMIDIPGVQYVTNHDYPSNNVLHSLMKARDYLEGPVIVTYSDIWVEPCIYQRLMETDGDIVLAVDRDWQPYYEGRTHHPVSEAENVYLADDGSVACIGKHLAPEPVDGMNCAEFLGLCRMSALGAKLFRSEFDAADARLGEDEPFQHSKKWRNAYFTDMIQHLVDKGKRVHCAVVERGWAELDTPQDYARLPDIAERQHLTTVIGGTAES